MRRQLPLSVALPLLLLMLVPAAGCKAGPPQLPEVATAGLRVLVVRSKNGSKSLDVTVRVWNDHDQRITFDLGDVRLRGKDGTEMSPNPGRTKPEVQAKNSADFRWLFNYQGKPALAPGTYDMEIKVIMVGDVQLDVPAQFQVVVG